MINLLTGIQSTSAALNAERVRMEVIAQNIANTNTTRGLDGKPYQRHQVVFENVLQRSLNGQDSTLGTVQIASITKDNRPPRLIHNPGHPEADSNGMVAMPDIDIHEEMADMIAASRAFEANLAVVKNSKAMALQILNVGKR